jgi:5-(carboxyamino)imidazole ribonucleotide synthase
VKHARAANEPLLPGSTAIGVLGGGQLGRMMALAARRMGYRIVVLDPSARCPTGQVADGVVVGALDDVEAALELAHQVDVITLDTEHVPADVLDELEQVTPVRPAAKVLRTIQDRRTQKEFLDSIGMPQARWRSIESDAELAAAAAALGGGAILKARRAGYDGKGQARLASPADAAAARAKLRGVDAVVEEVVPFTREISVVLARGHGGDVRLYPIAENVHRHHILHTTRAPAPMTDAGRKAAQDIAVAIIGALDHVGVMAVEMFELADGRLLVNEIAPRTHNSGHYTYGASATSQFEQHVRAVCGLPLGETRMLSGAVMLNLLGDLWENGTPAWQHVLARPEARLHLYGKDAPAPGRKMGHVLFLDDDTDRALANAEDVLAKLTGSS